MQWSRSPKADAADFIEAEILVVLDLAQGIDVHLVANFLNNRFDLLGGVAQVVLTTRLKLSALGEPADHGFDFLAFFRRIIRLGDHITAADIDFVLECHGAGKRRERLLHWAVERLDRLDLGGEA